MEWSPDEVRVCYTNTSIQIDPDNGGHAHFTQHVVSCVFIISHTATVWEFLKSFVMHPIALMDSYLVKSEPSFKLDFKNKDIHQKGVWGFYDDLTTKLLVQFELCNVALN